VSPQPQQPTVVTHSNPELVALIQAAERKAETAGSCCHWVRNCLICHCVPCLVLIVLVVLVLVGVIPLWELVNPGGDTTPAPLSVGD